MHFPNKLDKSIGALLNFMNHGGITNFAIIASDRDGTV